MSWQRARQPGQVNERIDAILVAASELFDERELTEISMQDVANQAGLGKASVYHYFKTKEEVFISLYRGELLEWLPDVQGRLKRLRKRNSSRIAAALVSALAERQQFCRLTVLVAAILERNLSTEFLRELKLSLVEPISQFVTSLQEVAPQLSDAAATQFVYQHHALISGLWPMAHPCPEVAEVMESEDDLNCFQMDFLSTIEQSFDQLLRGHGVPAK